MSKSNHLSKQKVQEVKELLRKRSSFINIKAEASKVFEPRMFQLKIENNNNLRNIVIISGALATFGLLLLNNTVANLNISFLRISIISFLLTIVFSSFQLNKDISCGFNSYQDELQKNIDIVERGEKIINDRLDDKISKSETDKQLKDVYRDIEYKQIRPREKEKKGKIYIYDLVSYLFGLSVVAMMLYFIYNPSIEFLLSV